MTSARVLEYVGVYDADGGVVGEVSYVVGHFLGTMQCALCDITHSWRRKPEWNAMAARLGVPFTLLHRNELGRRADATQLESAVAGAGLPVVLGRTADGWATVLDREGLEQAGGSVDEFERMLRASA